MRHVVRGLVVFGVLIGAGAGRADADCWYQWSCSGVCSGQSQLAVGDNPHFATRDVCEAALAADPAHQTIMESGNVGTISSSCTCSDEDVAVQQDATTSPTVVTFARMKLGAVAGMPWRIEEQGGARSDGTGSIGADLDVHFGRPAIGIGMSAGIMVSSLQSPRFGPDAKGNVSFPLTLGLTSSPVGFRLAGRETRLDLGLAFAFIPCSVCSEVGSFAYGARFRLGLDRYFGRFGGVGVDFLLTLAKAGDLSSPTSPYEAWAPAAQLRVSMIVRNPGVAGWNVREGGGSSNAGRPHSRKGIIVGVIIGAAAAGGAVAGYLLAR